MTTAPRPWWRGAVVYQVYVRSFCDGNGDGQGDFAGLLSKIDYISALGVDAIWLSPIHPSPNRDWGYDVSDYDGVHPDYGTLDDFQHLVEAAHARGLKVVLDEVLAHTSDQHPWFAASRDGDADKRGWYVPLGPAHAALAVAAQEHDPGSVLAFARAMLKARNTHADLRDADLTLLDAPLPLLAFRRGGVFCAFNLGSAAMEWTLSEQVTAFDFGTGDVERSGDRLRLGPLSAWFGRL